MNIQDEELFSRYLKVVAKYPVMTREQELRAFRLLKKLEKMYNSEVSKNRKKTLLHRIKKVKDYIILRNLRLPITIAKQMVSRDVSFIDVIDDATIGLIEAVNRFDPERGTHFSTYASWWIKQAIFKSLNEDFRTLKIPPGKLPLMRKFYKVSSRLLKEKGENPTLSEIAKEMNINSGEMIKLLSALQKPVYLSSYVSSEDGRQYEDLIEDESKVSPVEYVMAQDLKRIVSSILKMLPQKERLVVEMRFGLGKNGRKYTLREVANKLGVSRERVRQIQNRAIERIKRYRITINLEDYLESI